MRARAEARTRSNGKLKVGIVSANWGAIAHLPAWRVLEDEVEVVAMCTANRDTAEAAAKRYGLPKPYWNIDDLCADPDIDIIDVGTKPSTRQGLVIKALEAGKHVYNGIPFAADLAHARRMLELQQEKALVGVIDAMIQRVPAVVRMKEMIDEGFLGGPFMILSSFNQSLLNHPPAGWPYMWFGDADSGAGAPRNLGSHMLNALVYLFGEVEEVVGQNRTFLKEWNFSDGSTFKPQTVDTTTALLRCKCGAMGSIATSWVAADGPGWFVEVYGSKGRLRAQAEGFPTAGATQLFAGAASSSYVPLATEVELPERLFQIPGTRLAHATRTRNLEEAAGLTAKASAVPAGVVSEGPHDLVLGSLFRSMVEEIRNGAPRAQPDFAQGFHVQQIVEAIYTSDETHAWVRIPELHR
jgi:predicted dehydrogenase